jgi:GntR family transcriptional regulator
MGQDPTARAKAGKGRPLYRQLAEQIRQAIRDGQFPVGSNLPSVLELAERFAVSPQTARDAVALLRSGGLVSTRRRGGTRVEATHVDRSGHVIGALEQLLAYGDSVLLKVTGKETIIARTDIAELLQCSPGEPWFRISGYRHLRDDPRPRVYLEVYVNAAYPLIFEKVTSRTKRIFSMFDEVYGEPFTEFRQELKTVALSPAAAECLRAPAGTIGLRYVNRFIGEFGETLEVSLNTHLLDDPDAISLRRSPVVPTV